MSHKIKARVGRYLLWGKDRREGEDDALTESRGATTSIEDSMTRSWINDIGISNVGTPLPNLTGRDIVPAPASFILGRWSPRSSLSNSSISESPTPAPHSPSGLASFFIPGLLYLLWSSTQKSADAESTIGLMEALALEPSKGSKSNTRVRSIMRSATIEDFSGNVQQLSCEMDEAFQKVGPTLANTENQNHIYDQDNATSTFTIHNAFLPTAFVKRPRATVARNSSISKLKRRKATRLYTADPSHLALKPPTTNKNSSLRWKLSQATEEMADVLSGKRINATASDEMWKMRRVKNKWSTEALTRHSMESIHSAMSDATDDTITPTRLSHIDAFPTDVDPAGIESPGQSLSLPPPIAPKRSRYRFLDNFKLKIHSGSSAHLDNIIPPSMPPLRRTLSFSSAPVLTTIFEASSIMTSEPLLVSPLSMTSDSPWQFSDYPEGPRPDRKGIVRGHSATRVLTSTLYSDLSPGFQHGTIRLNRQPNRVVSPQETSSERSSLSICSTPIEYRGPHRKQNEDSCDLVNRSLDLRAFQTAMAGVAGDHLTADSHVMAMSKEADLWREEMDQENEDLTMWWEDFGLAAGRLVRGELEGEKEKEKTKLEIRERQPRPESEPNISEEYRIRRLPTPPHLCLENETSIVQQNGDLGWKGKGKAATCEDEVSLPPSPMENINTGILRHKSGFVPMGSNITHDLRDFLEWKSEFVDELAEEGAKGD